jgi:hypothetical protein
MANRLFFDGFELGYSLFDSGMAVTTDPVFDGNYAGVSTSAVKAGFSFSEVWGAFRIRKEADPVAYLLTFRISGSIVATMQINSGGNLEVRRGSTAGTLLGTGTTVLSDDTWYLVEYHYKADDSAGRWEVKVNGGAAEIDYTGDTTSGGTTINEVLLCSSSAVYYDNFIMDGTTWIGDTRIQGLPVTGAGNSTQWTPSTGNNWDCVDEIPASDTDYVSTNTNDQIDLYTLEDLTGSIASVKAVQVAARAQKEGSPTPQQIALLVRTGSTDYASGDKALTTAIAGHANIWNTNPNTSAAWASSEVNGLQIGIKARA